MAVISDQDRDSLHVLPLCIVPLETPVLQRTRMIKNAHLESVVEMFEGKDTGSGQIKVDALRMAFDSVSNVDLEVLGKLAKLNSYDVYGLRILLRKLGIDVDEGELRLSEAKQQELRDHMRKFTRPLIGYVYGDERALADSTDVIQMLGDPDVKKARAQLRALSDRLGIRLDQVPKFLQDYGDIFLSISYYRQCFGGVAPSLTGFQESVDEIRTNRLLQHDRNLIDTCTRVRTVVSDLAASMQQRFRTFEFGSKYMWQEIDAVRFQKFRELVHNNHTLMGGVLCALSLKMDAWTQQFPDPKYGGPMRRAEFIVTEMQQGLERFRKPRLEGPRLASNTARPKAVPMARAAGRVWAVAR